MMQEDFRTAAQVVGLLRLGADKDRGDNCSPDCCTLRRLKGDRPAWMNNFLKIFQDRIGAHRRQAGLMAFHNARSANGGDGHYGTLEPWPMHVPCPLL
jgi:hypothetical protein